MSPTYNLKVIDFGDAKKVDEVLENNTNNHPLKRKGTMVGTLNYMSPEVIEDRD